MIHHCNNKYGDYHVAVIAGTTYVLTGTPGTQTFIVPASLTALKTYTTTALTECLKQGAQLHTEGFTNHTKLRLSIMKLYEARKLTQQQTKELNEFSYRADSRPTFVRRRMRSFGLTEPTIREMDFAEPDSQYASTLAAMVEFVKTHKEES